MVNIMLNNIVLFLKLCFKNSVGLTAQKPLGIFLCSLFYCFVVPSHQTFLLLLSKRWEL